MPEDDVTREAVIGPGSSSILLYKRLTSIHTCSNLDVDAAITQNVSFAVASRSASRGAVHIQRIQHGRVTPGSHCLV
jgi:hypothetical protein